MLILGVSGGDLLGELRAVSLEFCVVAADAAVCTLLWSTVTACERAVRRINSAAVFDVDAGLVQRVRSAAAHVAAAPAAGGASATDKAATDPSLAAAALELPYVGVRGLVVPRRHAIASQWRPDVTGVMRRQAVSEHSVSWSSHLGLWSEQTRVLRDSTDSVPFCLINASANSPDGNSNTVDVESVQRLWHVDLSTVHDQYVPAPPASLGVAIWHWLTGEQPRGVQDVEQMLISGTPVTAFGRLQINSGDGKLTLSPPVDGAPFLLSTHRTDELVERLLLERRPVRWLAVALSALGVCYGCWLLWRVVRGLRVKRLRRVLLLQWDDIRTARRRRERDAGAVPPAVQCVVCLSNPREVVLSPCQHVCLCVDCEEQLVERSCPVCRQRVHTVRPAYIA